MISRTLPQTPHVMNSTPLIVQVWILWQSFCIPNFKPRPDIPAEQSRVKRSSMSRLNNELKCCVYVCVYVRDGGSYTLYSCFIRSSTESSLLALKMLLSFSHKTTYVASKPANIPLVCVTEAKDTLLGGRGGNFLTFPVTKSITLKQRWLYFSPCTTQNTFTLSVVRV